MKNISVCLSPELIHLFDLSGKTVVVVDILRATSCITTAFAHGIQSMRPVASIDECRALKNDGYVIAGERGGKKVDGFDIGNSPFSYMEPDLKGKKVAITTTNGTLAIEKSRTADHILIGSFLNIKVLANKINQLDNDLVIHCAGWKGSVNAEDTVFAGALIEQLSTNYHPSTDDASVAHALYLHNKKDLLTYVSQSSHANRLKGFGIMQDVEYCLEYDKYDIVPYLKNDVIII